jgi:hypothetical protein
MATAVIEITVKGEAGLWDKNLGGKLAPPALNYVG